MPPLVFPLVSSSLWSLHPLVSPALLRLPLSLVSPSLLSHPAFLSYSFLPCYRFYLSFPLPSPTAVALCCLLFLSYLSLCILLPMLVFILRSSSISYVCRLGYSLLLAAAIEPLGPLFSIGQPSYPAKLPCNKADYCVAFSSRSFLIASYMGRLCVALFYLPLCKHKLTLVYSQFVFSVLR